MLTKKIDPLLQEETKPLPKSTKRTQPTTDGQIETAATATTRKGKTVTSRVIAKFDVGFNNQLTIRGQGANLTWNKGIPLKNIGPDEWVWETTAVFNTLEFKILVNDSVYEHGHNHTLNYGATVEYSPHF